MEFKKMREYSHGEFVNIVSGLNEEELLNFSANYGGYPVLFRMSLDERLAHIPFIQTGSSVIIVNEDGEVLLQERQDNGNWGLPGGCQELGEDLRETAAREVYEETGIKIDSKSLVLIDTISGESRKRSYPNGDIVFNNTSLYVVKITNEQKNDIKCDSESKQLKFFDINNLPNNLHDGDLIEAYINHKLG